MSDYVQIDFGPPEVFEAVCAIRACLDRLPTPEASEDDLKAWVGDVTDEAEKLRVWLQSNADDYYHVPAVWQIRFFCRVAQEYGVMLSLNQTAVLQEQAARVRNSFNDMSTWVFMAAEQSNIGTEE